MSYYRSMNEFKNAHPLASEAMQCVFVSEWGEIEQAIMLVEEWHSEIKNLMTQYVFVNGWKSIVHAIAV